MKRLSTGVLSVLFAAGLGLNAVAAPSALASHGNIGTNAIAQAASAPAAAPAADFGSPPSGQIPILFNDHHVYAKPDKLKEGRVLAALVRGGTILIPLRSMFEQMGATVAYDPASKTVDVSKAGADVKVTVGKPEVVINGESRPLDVPPEIYQGHVVVPVRVISEGMGAYVQWVPEQRVVVVRYVPPTPPPTPAPTPVPTVAPTPTPTAAPTPYKDLFIVGDYIISPKVYNEFSPGNTGNNSNGGFSYSVRGAWEFNLGNIPWMLEGDYRQYNYPHNQIAATPAGFVPGTACGTPGYPTPGTDPACVTVIGGGAQTFVPAFTVRDYDFDARLGFKVLDPRVYIGIGYVWRANNAGYPKMNNVGAGIEKLPDLDQPFSVYGSFWFYPNIKGTAFCAVAGTSCTLSYNDMKYEIGGTFNFGQSPLYLDFGFLGNQLYNRTNGPTNETEVGPYVGLGLHF
ncbi:MAG: copper amine oxidase N-terminal domain-containing protein [Candidatus Eremiobacteraeota bacterium]|nr:copper amine oxidase N-terminal domain-containing protein [Candidatus Eremiobacteraeota bacterium]